MVVPCQCITVRALGRALGFIQVIFLRGFPLGAPSVEHTLGAPYGRHISDTPFGGHPSGAPSGKCPLAAPSVKNLSGICPEECSPIASKDQKSFAPSLELGDEKAKKHKKRGLELAAFELSSEN